MAAGIRPARVLLVLFEALAITLGLLYIGEYLGWSWVREAGGLTVGAVL